MGGFPNFNLFIAESWAPGGGGDIFPWPFPSSNVVIGTNPLYTVTDFLNVFPKFGGLPLNLTCIVTQSSTSIKLEANPGGVLVGQLITGPQIPPGTFITAGPDSTYMITISNAATANGTQVVIFNQPIVPMFVLQLYVNLASASLVQARWQDQWYIGMAMFIAHFATLYLKSDGDMYNTAGQAAVAGLSTGIATSKSAGGVSISYTPVTPGIDTWAAWNLTSYGQQFATMAKCIGAGPIWLF